MKSVSGSTTAPEKIDDIRAFARRKLKNGGSLISFFSYFYSESIRIFGMRTDDRFRPKGRGRNRWRIAFGIYLASTALLFLWKSYVVIDQGVTIACLEESYAVAEIINRACRSKAEVERLLSRHRLYGYMDFETDTIGLEKMVLIFENDTLKAVAEYR